MGIKKCCTCRYWRGDTSNSEKRGCLLTLKKMVSNEVCDDWDSDNNPANTKLTKLEQIAAMAMQGDWAINVTTPLKLVNFKERAHIYYQMANAMIEEGKKYE